MKLLTPQQTKESKTTEQALSIFRSRELAEAEKKLRLSLNNAEIEFKETLLKNQELWVKIEQGHTKRKIEIQQEIDDLEAKKVNFLIPYNILKGSTETKFKEAKELLEELRKREKFVKEEKEKYAQKLAILQNERLELERQVFDNKALQQNLTNQLKNAQTNTDRIYKETLELNNRVAEFEKGSQEKEEKIANLQVYLDGFRDDLEHKEQDLKNREIRLADEREVLKQAWDELQRKYSPK